METTHQKGKSIFSNAKWLFKPNCFILLSEHRGALLLVGTCPLLPPKAPRAGRPALSGLWLGVCVLGPPSVEALALSQSTAGGSAVVAGEKAAGLQERRWQGELLAKRENLNYCQLESSTHAQPLEAGGLAPACPSCCNPPGAWCGPWCGEIICIIVLLPHLMIWPQAPGMPLLPLAGKDLCLVCCLANTLKGFSHPVGGDPVLPAEGAPFAFS